MQRAPICCKVYTRHPKVRIHAVTNAAVSIAGCRGTQVAAILRPGGRSLQQRGTRVCIPGVAAALGLTWARGLVTAAATSAPSSARALSAPHQAGAPVPARAQDAECPSPESPLAREAACDLRTDTKHGTLLNNPDNSSSFQPGRALTPRRRSAGPLRGYRTASVRVSTERTPEERCLHPGSPGGAGRPGPHAALLCVRGKAGPGRWHSRPR